MALNPSNSSSFEQLALKGLNGAKWEASPKLVGQAPLFH